MPVDIGDVRLVAQTEDVIGEVPQWDARDQCLSWADILKPAFHRYTPATGEVRSWRPPEKFGSYALRDHGALLVAARGGMAVWDPETGRFERVSEPEADRPDNILNDGRCDKNGRFVVGSMDKTLAGPNGRLWQVSSGRGTVLLQDHGIFLPNALCWSPDGRTLYFGDTHTQLIHAYDYDPASGAIANRRLFADTSSLPGEPDGASVDAQGYLWNARFDGGCIVRFAPDGSVDQVVQLAVSRPTHVTFGGQDLRTLYITTARFRLSPEALAREPMAGGLLAAQVGVAGLPEPLFASGANAAPKRMDP
jgi:sugar lactone lactonase YvrE